MVDRSEVVRGGTLYLVKWAGWAEEHNSWEPAHHCSPTLIADFNEGKTEPPAASRERA